MNSNIEKKISLIDKFIKAYSSFDTQTIDFLIDDNFEFKNISQGELIEDAANKIEFTLVLEQSKILFRNRDIKIESLNIKENTAQVDVLINATMAISTPDGLRAGQEISYKVRFILILEESKIKKLSLLA